MAVNVVMQPSYQSCPMDISALYCSWGDMCTVLSLLVSNMLRFSSSLWVSLIRLPSSRSTWGHIMIFTFCARSVKLDVVLHISCVRYATCMVMDGWVPTTVITFNSAIS